jgi:hypothetical protein
MTCSPAADDVSAVLTLLTTPRTLYCAADVRSTGVVEGERDADG